jgi:hypothetical protein
MSTPIRQSHFGGGEIDPNAQGHTKSIHVQRGLATCRNAFSAQDGAWMNRPGLQYIGRAQATAVRLVPFIFSDEQTFVIELGDLYARFWSGGAAVGAPFVLVTPWAALDVPRLKFNQVGDVIVVTHPSYAPRQIDRISNTNWTVATLAIVPPSASFDAGQNADLGAAPIDDATHPLKDWRFKAAAIVQRADGSIYETTAIDATALAYSAGHTYAVNDLVLYGGLVYRSKVSPNLGNQPDISAASWTTDGGWGKSCPADDKPMWFQLASGSITIVDGAAGDVPLGLRWYLGKSGSQATVFGWIGDLTVGAYFRYDGQEPDFSIQPKLGTNPFDAAGKYPAAVAHYDQRRLFGRSNLQPATFWASALGDFNDFDKPFPTEEDDSFDFKLAQLRLEEIRSMVGHERLLLFTGAGVWAASGSQGDAISAVSIIARKSTGNPGASWLDPIVAQTRVLYQTARGNRVRDLHFDYNANAYVGEDVTLHGRHLLEGFNIVDWCYQEHPFSIVWAVRDDGALLSLTYDATQSPPVLALARHDTGDGDTFERCCCVPENTTETGPDGSTFEAIPDAVYFLVNRRGIKTFERLAGRVVSDGEDQRSMIYLDSSQALAYLNADVGYFMRASGASYAAGDEVTIDVTGGIPFASAPAYYIGMAVVFGVAGDDAPDIRATVTQVVTSTQVKAILEDALPAAYQNVATLDWGFAFKYFPFVPTHLNGRQVYVLGDGALQGPFTVTGGAITLDTPALYTVVGLAYDSDGELLDLPGDGARGHVSSVDSVTLEVVNSRGFKVGQDFDHLSSVPGRKVADSYDVPALTTGRVDVKPKGTWNIRGRACWRQSSPLPLTVAAATREVTYGGKP